MFLVFSEKQLEVWWIFSPNFLLFIHPGEIPSGLRYRSCMGGAKSQSQEAALPAGLVPQRQAFAGSGLEEQDLLVLAAGDLPLGA